MTITEIVTSAIVFVFCGAGLFVFVGDLLEDIKNPYKDPKQQLSALTMDILMVVILVAAFVTLSRDLIGRTS
jgi:hypothetical protein